MASTAPIVELHDVHASYLQKEILRGVTFSVRPGEIVALLGENGSGKSTTLKVIAGLLMASQGSVRFQGRVVNGLGVSERQQLGVGYLMQGGRIFPNLTVQENFNLAVERSHNGNNRTVARLGDWFFPLRHLRNQRAGLLSGGQRKMLSTEMIFAQKPSILLLDEPTAALTADLALEVLSSIRRCTSSTGASVLLVEQNATAVLAVSDQTLRLDQGTLTTTQHTL